MTRPSVPHPWDVVVLDAQAVSLWMDDDRTFVASLHRLFLSQTPLVVCTNTLIDVAAHPQRHRLSWLLSKVRLEPVDIEVATKAASLLCDAHLTGHRYAIDASVVAVALKWAHALIITSNPDDIYRLSQGQVDILPV